MLCVELSETFLLYWIINVLLAVASVTLAYQGVLCLKEDTWRAHVPNHLHFLTEVPVQLPFPTDWIVIKYK